MGARLVGHESDAPREDPGAVCSEADSIELEYELGFEAFAAHQPSPSQGNGKAQQLPMIRKLTSPSSVASSSSVSSPETAPSGAASAAAAANCGGPGGTAFLERPRSPPGGAPILEAQEQEELDEVVGRSPPGGSPILKAEEQQDQREVAGRSPSGGAPILEAEEEQDLGELVRRSPPGVAPILDAEEEQDLGELVGRSPEPAAVPLCPSRESSGTQTSVHR